MSRYSGRCILRRLVIIYHRDFYFILDYYYHISFLSLKYYVFWIISYFRIFATLRYHINLILLFSVSFVFCFYCSLLQIQLLYYFKCDLSTLFIYWSIHLCALLINFLIYIPFFSKTISFIKIEICIHVCRHLCIYLFIYLFIHLFVD